VASTDLDGAEVMKARIREQLDKLPELAAAGTFAISMRPVSTTQDSSQPLAVQVAAVAQRITEIMQSNSSAVKGCN
jgi:hypothetical protein